MFRFISVLERKRKAKNAALKELVQFEKYKNIIARFSPNINLEKKLLLIRLDDIGDYILFRNTLKIYKRSKEWKDYKISFLANNAWKDLYESKDNSFANDVIWVNKAEYINNDDYKIRIWKQLRSCGFETVICPSRTRPILLDDICALATGCLQYIGVESIATHTFHKNISDNIYSKLFSVSSNKLMHEFYFNQQFADWCCNANEVQLRPSIIYNQMQSNVYIICFVGASAPSKRWPEKRWIKFIKLCKYQYELKILIAGGKNDEQSAARIAAATNSENIAGKYSLTDLTDVIGNSKAVLTNDTMAAHLSVACNKPTFIIANGNHDFRFTNYIKTGIENVFTFYPEHFISRQKNTAENNFENPVVVTADIASIKAGKVFSVFKDVINKILSFQPTNYVSK